jgi:hypothetical protein
MSLPERQSDLLRELADRARRGRDTLSFVVRAAAGRADVVFESGAPPLAGVPVGDLEALVDRGFLRARPGPAGGTEAFLTEGGLDYVATNLRPLAGG